MLIWQQWKMSKWFGPKVVLYAEKVQATESGRIFWLLKSVCTGISIGSDSHYIQKVIQAEHWLLIWNGKILWQYKYCKYSDVVYLYHILFLSPMSYYILFYFSFTSFLDCSADSVKSCCPYHKCAGKKCSQSRSNLQHIVAKHS